MMGWRLVDSGSGPLPQRWQQVASDEQPGSGHRRSLPVNVWEGGREVVIEASLPGVAPEDVELRGADGVLDIRAQALVAEREYLHQEMFPLEYRRQIALPAGCHLEAAEAVVEHGLLSIRVPKSRPPAPIRIQIDHRAPALTTIEAEPGSGLQVTRVEGASRARSGPKAP